LRVDRGLKLAARRFLQSGAGLSGAEYDGDMNDLRRIGIAVPDDLLTNFDRLIDRRGYANRSEAFRDLMRDAMMGETVSNVKEQVVGTLTLVYDHNLRLLNERLLKQQHEHHGQIISALHVHLDASNCLEVLVLRGTAGQVQHIADGLIAAKGVRHGKLTLTTAF
jgi:CopG family transcriptional regulator, nickel-responsive regulator